MFTWKYAIINQICQLEMRTKMEHSALKDCVTRLWYNVRMTNQFVEAAKTQKRAYEQQRATHSDAVATGNLIAAQKSARAAKMAAGAALAAAVAAIVSVLVAIVK